MIAAHLRKHRPKPHATWHLDEVYLQIDGRTVYLWRALDAEGEVLDGTCHENLALVERKSEGLGSSLARGRGPPVLQRVPSEDAERVAGNKMALNVECILDDGVNSQEPLRRSGRFETLHLPLASSHRQMRILGPVVRPQALLMASR